MINRKAYFLKKNDKKMSSFFFSQLELQEKYSEKLATEGYTIGVMQYSHLEKKDEREYVTLWTDDSGLHYHSDGDHFYANYETCWGEMPCTWNTRIEVDKRDIIPHSSTTVKIAPRAKLKKLGKYTQKELNELSIRFAEEFFEELKPLQVSENRIRLYVNCAGETLINDGWHTVSCYYLTGDKQPRNGHYLIEMDMDKARSGYQRGNIRADGTHHIKIIKKVVAKN